MNVVHDLQFRTMHAPSGELHPSKQDAIHRALLPGLLGNVGEKTDAHEYTGVRGRKFHLFPGSALFRSRPPWVVAAEIVETTKLYARTVAPINPLWVERAAEHLVKRTYADPHWSAQAGRVLAHERVTLHGLVLVPKRKVHYGPIDPTLSHEIFVNHALVLAELQSDAPFLRHNRELIEQVQAIEAKARRRDVLVDPKGRFEFYQSRVPPRIYTAHEFEKWRRQAEKQDPHVLFMTRRDLMLHEALGVTQDLYPDALDVNGLHVPLEYRYEPAHRADGITATIPLAALNQLSQEQFEWLVPGFRKDKFAALIRTLPKALRVKFVPVPQFAEAAARDLSPQDGPLLPALATILGKASGETVRPEDFQPDALMDYLRLNFRVTDASGKQVMMGRDLEALRRKLGVQARRSFAESPVPEWHRDGITRWDIPDLPDRVEVRRNGLSLIGYPTLVDAGESVSLRLFDSPDPAREALHAGLRRLFVLQISSEIRHLALAIERDESMPLHYSTLGTCDELKNELITAIADRALFDEEGDNIRTREAFAARAEAGWRRLNAAAAEVIDLVRQSLELYHCLGLALSPTFPPLWSDSIHDIRDQLAHLIYPGFVVQTPFQWLRHLPRYLRAIEIRLRKLANAGLTRDLQATAEVKPLWDRYKLRELDHRQRDVRDPALEQYRWLLEELRVSLFAQELKAAVSVSRQRLEKQWELTRK